MALFAIRSRRVTPAGFVSLVCSWCKSEVEELGPPGTFTMCAQCLGWLDDSGTLAPREAEEVTAAEARPCTP